MRETVLVTGGAGFVGTALIRSLLADGLSVVAVIRDWTREPRGVTIARGDITDRGLCQRVLADYEISTIYHLAAQSIVSACAEDPLTALDVAVMGTGALLQAVRDAGRPIETIVSTSDKVYGSSPSPYTEKTPLDARHAYEVSKACQDLVARMFFHNYGVDVRVVRAVNIYGPGDPNESRLVPQTVRRLLKGERPLLHVGSAGMRRQYVYVDDVVRAFRAVCERGTPGEAYCVGGADEPRSVSDVIEEISRQIIGGTGEVAVEVRERAGRFREIAEQSVDDRKLRIGLGWTPEVSFSEGVRRTIQWYKEGAR